MINIEIVLHEAHGSISIGIFDTLHDPASTERDTERILAALRIPERFRVGVATIASVTDASFSDLVKALKSSAVGDTAQHLALKIEDQVPSIPVKERAAIIAAISAMQSVQKSSHADLTKFTMDMWDALEDDAPELLEGVDEDTLKTRLETLLHDTSIHLTSSKVAELRSEIERAFCGARILTDVRTAFPDDATKRPAMTILHTLELMFHDDIGRHREFYVGMDDKDLIILKDVVDRAIQKKATLVELLKKAEFELFD